MAEHNPTPDVDAAEQEHLAELEPLFLAALRHKDAGRVDDAEDALRDILKIDPRLAEPHLELARVLLDSERLDDAEAHAREGLEHLRAGGQWTDDLPDHVVAALAHALLAEVLRRRADDDNVIFGDPETFHALVRESKEHFEEAARLDPSDDYASYHAFFLGRSPEEGGGA